MTLDLLYALGVAFGAVALMGLAMWVAGWLLTWFIWRVG